MRSEKYDEHILNFRYENSVIESSNFAYLFSKDTDKSERKPKGQFFTPKEIAQYMASKVKIVGDDISVLDPCAGTGSLISAFCDKVFVEVKFPITVNIHAYEIDEKLIKYLKLALNLCKKELESLNHVVNINIFEENFIEKNSKYLQHDFCDNENSEELDYFDVILSNPPYFKLKSDSKEYEIMNGFLNGQPNIYSSFVILSTKMLKKGGQFVHIIPRSFCSGLYYKNMRNWLNDNTCINGIHIFKSRSKIFDLQEVIQEVIILYGHAGEPKSCHKVLISTSTDRFFEDYDKFSSSYSNIIHSYEENDNYIRIPSSNSDINILETVDSWDHTLNDFGITASTGKVVDFRTLDNLCDTFDKDDCVPLLWMQNLEQTGVNFCPKNFTKKRGIMVNDETKNILVPVQNYVLLKRLTSKCNKKRLFPSPFIKKQFIDFKFIGFENHLNYIHGINRSLEVREVKGLCTLLNSDMLEVYFRAMNGSTQVNITDLLKLPMPEYEIICKLGDIKEPDDINKILKNQLEKSDS